MRRVFALSDLALAELTRLVASRRAAGSLQLLPSRGGPDPARSPPSAVSRLGLGSARMTSHGSRGVAQEVAALQQLRTLWAKYEAFCRDIAGYVGAEARAAEASLAAERQAAAQRGRDAFRCARMLRRLRLAVRVRMWPRGGGEGALLRGACPSAAAPPTPSSSCLTTAGGQAGAAAFRERRRGGGGGRWGRYDGSPPAGRRGVGILVVLLRRLFF